MNPLFANTHILCFYAMHQQHSKIVGFTHCPYKRSWLFFYHTSQIYTNSHLFSLPLVLEEILCKVNRHHMIKGQSSVLSLHKEDMDYQKTPLVFNSLILQHEANIPQQFIWPDHEKPNLQKTKELVVPLVDLGGFLSGRPSSAKEASVVVGDACKKHGFFLVTNHGVDASLIADAHRYMDLFFELPLLDKQRAQRKLGESCGYASSFTGRFSSKLPWKETLSFQFSGEKSPANGVKDYFENTLGKEFTRLGYVILLNLSICNTSF